MVVPTETVAIYWGAGGEYGPFDKQQDGEWAGWPHFGQVMRYFRRKAKYTAKEFGLIYGRLVNSDGAAISERQILRMELENKVPVDMNRRKIIVHLLNIPPMLLGLAALEDIQLQPHIQPAHAKIATGHTILPRVTLDTTKYQSNIRTLWTLHDTSQVQNSLDQIDADIRDLKSLEQQTKGDLRYRIQELLFSYHLLTAHIIRDKREFSMSYSHSNEAVRIAKEMNDSEILATALYNRGCTYLEWGAFGILKMGVFQVQQNKIEGAIHDFERAKALHEDKSTQKNIHPQLLGRINVHLSRAYAILSISKGERAPKSALMMLDDASATVDSQNINDPYISALVTGERIGFTPGGYHSTRAAGFNAARMPGAALQELNTLEKLQKGVSQDLTRRHVWLDIVAANSYLTLEQFEEATDRAIKALAASHDIKSVTNLINIVDIHGQLLNSPYRIEADVQELGDILREVLTRHIVRKEK